KTWIFRLVNFFVQYFVKIESTSFLYSDCSVNILMTIRLQWSLLSHQHTISNVVSDKYILYSRTTLICYCFKLSTIFDSPSYLFLLT
uniref:Uncharacterized protein n=1 Tax=Aegilops tauschii subsp. strangulata TaxID=200361 RepID=A0A453NIF4_AEGTS